jgi:hypothetical protein
MKFIKTDVKAVIAAKVDQAKANKAAEEVAKEAGKLPDGFKDVLLFDAGILGERHSYFVRKPVTEMDVTYNPDADVPFNKRIIGKLVDFKVGIAGQQTHGSTAAVLAFGDLGLGARKTSATVIVQCGVYTKAYTVNKMTPKVNKALYSQIAFTDARRERLAEAAKTGVAAAPVTSPTVVLAQINQLHDDGLLTADEFAVKCAEVIGRM